MSAGSQTVGETTSLVTIRKPGCRTCRQHPDVIREVNAAIWDGTTRTRAYRLNARRVLAQHGVSLSGDAITRHAEHTEATWRQPSGQSPATSREIAVFPTDYESYTDHAARVGALALHKLERRIGSMEDRELVQVARMGVSTVVERRKIEATEKRPQLNIQAVFGVVSGHFDTPPEEIKDVTPLAELHDELNAEREALMLNAGYDGDELGSVLDG